MGQFKTYILEGVLEYCPRVSEQCPVPELGSGMVGSGVLGSCLSQFCAAVTEHTGLDNL